MPKWSGPKLFSGSSRETINSTDKGPRKLRLSLENCTSGVGPPFYTSSDNMSDVGSPSFAIRLSDVGLLPSQQCNASTLTPLQGDNTRLTKKGSALSRKSEKNLLNLSYKRSVVMERVRMFETVAARKSANSKFVKNKEQRKKIGKLDFKFPPSAEREVEYHKENWGYGRHSLPRTENDKVSAVILEEEKHERENAKTWV